MKELLIAVSYVGMLMLPGVIALWLDGKFPDYRTSQDACDLPEV